MIGKQKKKYLIIILIVTLIIGLGVAIAIYINKVRNGESDSDEELSKDSGGEISEGGDKTKNIINDSSKSKLSNDIIVSIPAGKFDSYDLIIVWGGISYANPEWMYKQIPKEILYRDIVVIAPYSASISKVDSVYKPFLEKKGYLNKIENTSIAGFSAGGIPTYKNYSQRYKLVGLIDPSTYESYSKLPFTNNTIMVYNERNWGGQFDSIKKAMPIVADSINRQGGKAERVNLSHAEIPKYFFKNYVR